MIEDRSRSERETEEELLNVSVEKTQASKQSSQSTCTKKSLLICSFIFFLSITFLVSIICLKLRNKILKKKIPAFAVDLKKILQGFNEKTLLSGDISDERFMEQRISQLLEKGQSLQETSELRTSSLEAFDLMIKDSQQVNPLLPAKSTYCIISSQPAAKFDDIVTHFEQWRRDSFVKWKAIYFINKKVSIDTNYVNGNFRHLIVQYTHGNVVKNIYDAVLNHCERHSIVVLSDYYEQILTENLLNKMAWSFYRNQGCFGFILSVEADGVIVNPNGDLSSFSRRIYAQQAGNDFHLLDNIEETFRVFQSDLFRLIPHWDLHDIDDNFYERKISFLLPILELGHFSNKQFPSSYENVISVPKILNFRLEPAFRFNKRPAVVMSQSDANAILQKAAYPPFKEILLMTKLYNLKDRRFPIKTPSIIGTFSKMKNEIIPNKIHQIWLNGDLPAVKAYFVNKNKEVAPTFVHRLWTKADITRKNFPATYETIQRLLQIESTFPFTRLSMVADMMRFEIIYRIGGFYLDINYLLLKDLEPVRHHHLFIPGTQSQFNMEFLNCGFYGAVPNSPYLKRLLEPSKLATIDIKGAANVATGPHYFYEILNVEDSVNPDIKIVPFDYGYPAYAWAFDSKMRVNACLYSSGATIPQNILLEHQVAVQGEGFKVLSKCEKLYPNAFGIDFFDFGGTWLKEKKKEMIK